MAPMLLIALAVIGPVVALGLLLWLADDLEPPVPPRSPNTAQASETRPPTPTSWDQRGWPIEIHLAGFPQRPGGRGAVHPPTSTPDEIKRSRSGRRPGQVAA